MCESPNITLQQHRQAAYLRSITYMLRMYFTVPPCRFCQLDSGNEGSHTGDYSQLYVRVCATFHRVAEAFCDGVRGVQCANWDLQVTVGVGAGKYCSLLVPDARLQYF